MSDSVKDKFLAEPSHYSEEAYVSLRERLLTIEQKYAKEVPNFDYLFSFMASAHENLGLLAYFVRHETVVFKQHWHLASRLRCHAARHVPDSDSYTTGGWMSMDSEFLYALASDSQAAIDEAANLETYRLLKHRDNPKALEFAFHLAQLILRGDYEAAQAKIEIGAKKAGGKVKQAYASGTDFYSLLMKGDKAALEASIMESTRFKKSGMPYICDFLYPGATFKTKLCWYKGIPVEIDHPMVPMAWMPVEPQPHYDDIYDFFAPDWTPPDQGLFARIARKFQKDYPAVDACMERVRRIDAPASPV
jgi:hypothetical protein